MQQINLAGNLEKNATTFFIIEEAKKTVFIFQMEHSKYYGFILF